MVDDPQSTLISGLAACRQGDNIVEAVGPPNKIAIGLMPFCERCAKGG